MLHLHVPGGPAAFSCELAVGDVLVAVDGVSVKGETPDEVAKRIVGPEGVPITITTRVRRMLAKESGMYVCMYVCIHACMYVCIYICMYIRVSKYTYTHTHTRTRARVHTHSLCSLIFFGGGLQWTWINP
jgi:hypothetical protein